MFYRTLHDIKTTLFPPFFSIVIPTRDRPEFIELGLELILAQSYKNFEVIVSDNSTTKPCSDVVSKFDDHRIRYISPDQPLEMAQHWEFACSHARGKYVSVLIDKTFLHTDALSLLHGELSKKRYDLVSWGNEIYVPIDEATSYRKGYYNPQYEAQPPFPFEPSEELERRMNCETDLWNEGAGYFRGKICFGAFSRKLITRIKQAQGRLFYSVCPDYTATASALALAQNALDMGQPLMASYLTSISNGMNYYKSPSYALNFLQQLDSSGAVLEELPIKNLFASTHNLIAGDYLRVKRALGNTLFPAELNSNNLDDRIINDLAVVGFDSDAELSSQLKHLLDVRPKLDECTQLDRVKTERKKRSLTGNQSDEEIKAIYESAYTKYDSPLDMAKSMARYYFEQLNPSTTSESLTDSSDNE